MVKNRDQDISFEIYRNRLSAFYRESPVLKIDNSDKIVIFSDLHLGNGGKNDDFKKNSALTETILRDYYNKKKYTLILNGDIEELQKFHLSAIAVRWKNIYNIFEQFIIHDRFYKIIGNHDYGLLLRKNLPGYENLLNGLVLDYKGDKLFLFHGHQASQLFEKYNSVVGFFLRYFVSPAGIPNHGVSRDNLKKFKIEQRVYNFARSEKIISVIGHTHRPLFESLSKRDSLRFQLEKILRDYPHLSRLRKPSAEKEIRLIKNRLMMLPEKERQLPGSFYNKDFVLPVLFNSGCAIGKRGVTCLEIDDGEIALIHWFDDARHPDDPVHDREGAEQMDKTPYFRQIIKKEPLSYIFARVKLLS